MCRNTIYAREALVAYVISSGRFALNYVPFARHTEVAAVDVTEAASINPYGVLYPTADHSQEPWRSRESGALFFEMSSLEMIHHDAA